MCNARNDFSQYPVFPWVLADYTSPYLNLEDLGSKVRKLRHPEWYKFPRGREMFQQGT